MEWFHFIRKDTGQQVAVNAREVLTITEEEGGEDGLIVLFKDLNNILVEGSMAELKEVFSNYS